MKELNKEFIGRGEVRGFMFTQLYKNDAGYLYEVKPPNSDVYYEVFEHKENRRYGTVTYPSSKVFGITAWTYKAIEVALTKFKTLK
jgi:hypothetical protein